MPRLVLVLAGVFLSLQLAAQDVHKANLTDAAALPKILDFEDQQTVGAPAGWTATPEGTVFSDDKIVHAGKWAARLERSPESSGAFSSLHGAIAMDFAGKTIELRGFLRLQQVEGFTGLWMREDGEGGRVAFENMQRKQLKGTSDWTEYSISLPIQPEGSTLFFGIVLAGTGKVWVDDLQLLVDGKPVWQAVKIGAVFTYREVMIPMRDGVRLQTIILTPVNQRVPLPILFRRTRAQ
jgi:hypothetical protein